jgi:hypothetical protein
LSLFLLPASSYSLLTPLRVEAGVNATLSSIGTGATIDGNQLGRIFDVSGRLELRGVHLKNGNLRVRNRRLEAGGEYFSNGNARAMTVSSNAAQGGGLLLRSGSALQLTDVTISGCSAVGTNVADAAGGALFLEGNNELVLNLVHFERCYASSEWRFSNGGVIYLGTSTYAVLTGVTFTACNATTAGMGAQGGALWMKEESQAWLSDCAFINCTSAGSSGGILGGAIEASSLTNIRIVRSRFVHCAARAGTDTATGGALYLATDAVASVLDSVFASNVAVSDTGSKGGAIFLDFDSSLVLCSTLISDCVAQGPTGYGGGLSSEGFVVMSNATRFVRCVATTSGQSVYVETGSATYVLPAPAGHW